MEATAMEMSLCALNTMSILPRRAKLLADVLEDYKFAIARDVQHCCPASTVEATV